MRFMILLTVVLPLSLPIATEAQPAAVAAALDHEETRVLAAEDAYVAAEVQRDEQALERLVDESFVRNNADGTTTDRTEFIRQVLRLRMLGQTLRERTVRREGNVALVFGTADIRFAAEESRAERVVSLRYLTAYVNREGQWRLLALQMQGRSRQ
jgi:hypothetical protein